MTNEKRLGRQTPTSSLILPYEKTFGQDAIELYEKTGRTAQEWQSLLIYDILAQDDEDLWVHSKFGYSVPRRNGKNEIIAIRELYGLINGERILHTAHRTPTSHSAWERLLELISNAGYKEKEDYKVLKQFGLEQIIMLNGEGKISFRTRTSKGGLGEGFDLLIIDEAQEYQDDQETSLKYVVSDSPNPQTIFCGTPPTVVSTGTVFTKLRESALGGKTRNTGWAEWSVEHKSQCDDVELWYKCNPSMGTILTERKVYDEIGEDELDFNIQRLGFWVKYNQHSEISKVEWNALKVDKLPLLKGNLHVGIKYSHSNDNVSMAIAVKTVDDNVFIEVIDCQNIKNGNEWILRFLVNAEFEKVVIDGANGQHILADQLRNEKIKNIILPRVNDIINAHSLFEQGIFKKTIQHSGQPSLTECATNVEKRAIGSNGGFGYKCTKENIDTALIDSVILAYWSCVNAKEKRPIQKVSY